jgi:hypothetical protein
LLFRHLYSLVHLLGAAALVSMLLAPRLRLGFERRCVGAASARDLAFVRIVVCVILFVYTLTEPLPSHARLGTTFFAPPGFSSYLGQGLFDWFFSSSARLWGVWLATFAALGLGALGVATRLTLPLAALSSLWVGALARALGKDFHEGYLALYALMVIAFFPAGDAWSFDSWWRRRRGSSAPEAAYAWMVWACYAAASIPYLQLAFSKLHHGGLFWFDGRSMRNYMLTDNLNIRESDWDLALRFYQAPTALFTALGFFGLLAELLYPLVLVVPRLRLILPVAIMLVHLGVWLGQDALFVDAVLLPAIFFVPSAWRRICR